MSHVVPLQVETEAAAAATSTVKLACCCAQHTHFRWHNRLRVSAGKATYGWITRRSKSPITAPEHQRKRLAQLAI